MSEPNHQEYLARIGQRVAADLAVIKARATPVRDGRRLPESGTLPIGTGRRLRATILFLDVSGFSDLPSEDPTEQTTILLSLTLLFSEFIRIIEDLGGVVEKNTGDGLMAYFVSDSDYNWTHESRACIAALYMFRASTSAVEPIFAAHGVASMPIRITVNAGNITVAEVGAKRGFRGVVAVGTAANVASKMLKVAQSGDLLVGENVLGGLPANWTSAMRFHSYSDQFSYRADGRAYGYYLITGRY
jgi:adenylate cyclase